MSGINFFDSLAKRKIRKPFTMNVYAVFHPITAQSFTDNIEERSGMRLTIVSNHGCRQHAFLQF